ncbi:MAG: hypothetical protein JWR14_7714 [Caballeronia sp.]|jgi:hypothetical protein|uniref:hypothetical protein n=1 Tax=Caballeronia sp. TaxID=1931223 RepID=UPI0026374BB9|nr:hypothetical protein [Caballeronia sp.]MDB5837884.1 hypothetical protein [Caballeronia sp.]
MRNLFAEDDAVALPLDVVGLRAWISMWYEHALSVGFIRPPYVLDEATSGRLESYYRLGLTPSESAGVMFGTLH